MSEKINSEFATDVTLKAQGDDVAPTPTLEEQFKRLQAENEALRTQMEEADKAATEKLKEVVQLKVGEAAVPQTEPEPISDIGYVINHEQCRKIRDSKGRPGCIVVVEAYHPEVLSEGEVKIFCQEKAEDFLRDPSIASERSSETASRVSWDDPTLVLPYKKGKAAYRAEMEFGRGFANI